LLCFAKESRGGLVFAADLFARFSTLAFGLLLAYKKLGELNQGLPPEKTSRN
jgi:hypothetical protein